MNAFRRRCLVAALIAAFLGGAGAASGAETVLANGVFLVAKPGSVDPNFRETVVLVTAPEVGAGPLGVIVNRPLAARLSEAVPELAEVPAQFDRLYGGGPVARNQLLFLVRCACSPAPSLQVLGDVFLSGDADLLDQIVRGAVKVESWRVYAGYSGWAPGQLQAEIARGGWYVIPADADVIFAEQPAAVWPELIKRIATRSTRFAPRDADGRAVVAR